MNLFRNSLTAPEVDYEGLESVKVIYPTKDEQCFTVIYGDLKPIHIPVGKQYCNQYLNTVMGTVGCVIAALQQGIEVRNETLQEEADRCLVKYRDVNGASLSLHDRVVIGKGKHCGTLVFLSVGNSPDTLKGTVAGDMMASPIDLEEISEPDEFGAVQLNVIRLENQMVTVQSQIGPQYSNGGTPVPYGGSFGMHQQPQPRM